MRWVDRPRLLTTCHFVQPGKRPSIRPHVHHARRHESTAESSSLRWHTSHLPSFLPSSLAAPSPRFPAACPRPVTASLCQGGTMAVVWTGASPPLPFLSSSPLRPCPCPPHAQALSGWHCANLPPPSLSFVAHLHVALPPVSTLPSLSPLLGFPLIHSFNRLPPAR